MYTLTPEIVQAAANRFDQLDIAFGSTELLPPYDEIPQEFKQFRGNAYVEFVEGLFFGAPPKMELKLRDGFSEEAVAKVIKSHLSSFEPKHEHKMAGVGYMLSLMAEWQVPA